MILFMLLLLVLARDNGWIVSPMCWILFGFYVWLRITVTLLGKADE